MCRHPLPLQLVSYSTRACRLRRRSDLAMAAMFCMLALQGRARRDVAA